MKNKNDLVLYLEKRMPYLMSRADIDGHSCLVVIEIDDIDVNEINQLLETCVVFGKTEIFAMDYYFRIEVDLRCNHES